MIYNSSSGLWGYVKHDIREVIGKVKSEITSRFGEECIVAYKGGQHMKPICSELSCNILSLNDYGCLKADEILELFKRDDNINVCNFDICNYDAHKLFKGSAKNNSVKCSMREARIYSLYVQSFL